jgi:nicotinamide-nucleotide amidase
VFEDYVKSFLLDNQKSFISFDNETIEQLLVKLLKKNNLTISFAESCSGGLMASTVINVSGASDVIKESYVTYSDEAKHKILNVKNKTIEQYSVYSKEVAVEMAKGLSFISKANICVSITGLAGGSTPNSNDGTYDACIIINYNSKEYIISFRKKEVGKRNDVRKRQVNYVFYRVIRALKDIL